MTITNSFFRNLATLGKEHTVTTEALSILFFCQVCSKGKALPLDVNEMEYCFDSCPLALKEYCLLRLRELHPTQRTPIVRFLTQHKDEPICQQPVDSALHNFYPQLLKAYDPLQHKERGTFYTDPIIAEFMVKQVDLFWREKYGCSLAEAPPQELQILDPALGSGIFLSACIHIIREERKRAWKTLPSSEKGHRWNNYLTAQGTGLLYRMKGLELDATALLIAQLRISWQLCSDPELPFHFARHDTLDLQQANALEYRADFSPTLILGNPPYNARSKPKNTWIAGLLEDYKYIDGVHFNERKHWLSDDYVQFIRMSQYYLSRARQAVLCFITPNTFLSAPSFRAMRWNLLQVFPSSLSLDLRGNHHHQHGQQDQNIFDIQQGVAISLFGKSSATATVSSSILCGSRSSKLQRLQENDICWTTHSPEAPTYSFLPVQRSKEYQEGFSLQDLFIQYSTGLQTGREHRLTSKSPDVLKQSFPEVSEANIIPYLHKPFQKRYLLYIPAGERKRFSALQLPRSYRIREKISQHVLGQNNIVFHFARSNRSGSNDHFFISRYCPDLKAVERSTGSVFAPLYIQTAKQSIQSNLNDDILKQIQDIIGETASRLSVIDYIYAKLYSPVYRSRYAKEISTDYPRIPYPQNAQAFHNLRKIGEELRQYHLQEHPDIAHSPDRFQNVGSNIVQKIQYKQNRLYINPTQWFEAVSPEMFSLRIGGYPVLSSWLKDRSHLSTAEVRNCNQLLCIIERTIQLMQEIAVIERKALVE